MVWRLQQKLQVFMQGELNMYREQDTEAAAKFKGLTSEDMLVYQAIQWAENTGIFTLLRLLMRAFIIRTHQHGCV
jgi:hypothetical protein